MKEPRARRWRGEGDQCGRLGVRAELALDGACSRWRGRQVSQKERAVLRALAGGRVEVARIALPARIEAIDP